MGCALFVGFFPVFKEFLEAAVGQGVFDDLLEDGEGRRDDVAADFGRFHEVDGAAGGGGENFGFKAVVVVDHPDVADEFEAVGTDVIEATDKGADVAGSGFGGEEGLVGVEAEGDVGLNPFGGEALDGFEAFGDEGNFDDDVFVPGGEDFAFFDHLVRIEADDFGTDGAVDDFGDFEDEILEVFAAFGGEGGVGGYAVDESPGGGFADFFGITGVDKDLHVREILGKGRDFTMKILAVGLKKREGSSRIARFQSGIGWNEECSWR